MGTQEWYFKWRNNYFAHIPSITVSFTSFPARIKTAHIVAQSMLKQTLAAERVILWLAEEQFPSKEEELPKELLALANEGLHIRWCDDMRSHKKYFYAMQEYSDNIIITVDDDQYYPNNLVENLVKSYMKHPYAVSANRAHIITLGRGNRINPYRLWEKEYSKTGTPSLLLCATGVGGVLYPPSIMQKETFEKDIIINSCINGDDLWLKVMQILSYTPVVLAKSAFNINTIEGTAESALFPVNVKSGNDAQLNKILHYVNKEEIINRLKSNLWQIKNSKNPLRKRLLSYSANKLKRFTLCVKQHGLIYTIKRIISKLVKRG